jgi:hypothetical protein
VAAEGAVGGRLVEGHEELYACVFGGIMQVVKLTQEA